MTIISLAFTSIEFSCKESPVDCCGSPKCTNSCSWQKLSFLPCLCPSPSGYLFLFPFLYDREVEGEGLETFGLGCSSAGISERTTVISWMDSSRVQPLAWSWVMAPHIFLSAAMNSGAITCLSPSSESRGGKMCSAILKSKALSTCRWHMLHSAYALRRTVEIRLSHSRGKRTELMPISGVSSQHNWERSDGALKTEFQS